MKISNVYIGGWFQRTMLQLSEIYDFLREDSSHYKELFRNKDYIKKVDSLAKEKYKLRRIDKIEKLSENLDLIKTFIDVLK